MTSTRARLRSLSLGEGASRGSSSSSSSNYNDSDGRPQPARFYFEAPSTPASRTKRSTVPRRPTLTSAGVNQDQYQEADRDPESAFRDIAREQVDRESLRELAQFLRSTGPPSSNGAPPVQDCFGRPGQGDSNGNNNRWSIRSLRANRGSSSKATSRRHASVQLGDRAKRRTTAAGHSYLAISVPPSPGQAPIPESSAAPEQQSMSLQAGLAGFQKTGLASRLGVVESVSGHGSTQRFLDRNTTCPGDVAAVVSRHPTQQDPNSFRLSIKVTAADSGVRSFMRMVDEWLEVQHGESEVAAVASTVNQDDKTVTVLSAMGADYTEAARDDVRSSGITVDVQEVQPDTPKSMLEVPQPGNVRPDSPGFPTLLATMAFPSPPDSAIPPPATNNVLPGLEGSSTTPSVSSPRPNPDQRLLEPRRPALRQARSENAAHSLYMAAQDDAHALEFGDRLTMDMSEMSMLDEGAYAPHFQGREAREYADAKYHRQSTSTANSLSSDLRRHSISSETSMASDVTTTRETIGSSVRASKRGSVDFYGDGRLPLRSQRSSIAGSFQSFSSAATGVTATSLAERRMARRNKVREKVQRDLEAATRSSSRASMQTTVDSPVLGWFPHQASPRKGPSPLAKQPHDAPEAAPRANTRRSSVQDVAQLIPETVRETSQLRPASESWTFTPIMAETTPPDYEPQLDPVPEDAPEPPSLTMTPIMVVASIQSRPSTTSLRPLSLLSTGSSSPVLPARSVLRPDKHPVPVRRHLPIRVSTGPHDLTVNTVLKSPPSQKSKKRISSIYSPPSDPSPFLGMERPTSDVDPSPASSSMPSPSMSPDMETQWLTAYQKQTARDWRLAALKDRMRLELDMSLNDDDDDGDDDVVRSDEEKRRLREKHTSMTLRVLNANARGQLGRPLSGTSDDSRSAVSEASVEGSAAAAAAVTAPAPAPSQQQSVEKQLLRAIVPLLESMDSTLKEMQKGSVNRELSAQIDSALDMVDPLATRRRESGE